MWQSAKWQSLVLHLVFGSRPVLQLSEWQSAGVAVGAFAVSGVTVGVVVVCSVVVGRVAVGARRCCNWG